MGNIWSILKEGYLIDITNKISVIVYLVYYIEERKNANMCF